MLQEALEEIWSQRPDGLLYHYTSQRGLLGIVETGDIWATDIRYLNDSSEFQLACDLAVRVIDRRRARANDSRKKTLLQGMRERASTAGLNVSVASFSANGDLLSQWRAYGEPSSGFAIGFDFADLKAAAEGEDWIISPCLYQQDAQIALMEELVDTALDGLLHRNATQTEREDLPGGDTAYYLNRYAGMFKHSSFEEEREWRLISRPLRSSHARYAYREGRSAITPYYKFPLPKDKKGRLKVKHIIVGPTPHPDLSRRAVTTLLARCEASTGCFSTEGDDWPALSL